MGKGWKIGMLLVVWLCIVPGMLAEDPAISSLLYQLYQATNGPEWVIKDNWGSPNYCTWEGIECSGNGTFALDLSNNRLEGTIPSDFGNLGASLRSLNLYSNNLYGTIPSSLGYLVDLEFIDISQNRFVGNLPNSMANLEKVEVFRVSENRMSGQFPSYMLSIFQRAAQFDSIRGCELGWNLFDCPIPAWVPPECAATCYDWPAGSPEIAPEINTLEIPTFGEIQPILDEFYIATNGQNWINQTEWTSTNPFCERFGVSCDPFTGQFTLKLIANNLVGTIPESFANLSESIIILQLGRNVLSGSIPDNLGELVALQEFDLSSNNLSGPIPPSLAHLTNTTQFWLESNLLTGEIDSTFQAVLDHAAETPDGCKLGGNLFTCPVPSLEPPLKVML
eukprot:Phypoly_transcript_08999.p1 GENE.Phypoly_transcript_08999~~Phypoly_transcript_08999.p1  ORF type:complete len:393 (+),score=30.13 Phypoly_transcript_08999:216-1394(+)